MEINGEVFLFRTLRTSEYDKKAPLPFIKHTIATTTFSKPGNYTIEIKPLQNGKELFKLKSIIVSPVQKRFLKMKMKNRNYLSFCFLFFC